MKFLNPLTSVLVLVFFFSPWAEVNCAYTGSQTISGYDLRQGSGFSWIIFIASIFSLILYYLIYISKVGSVNKNLLYIPPILSMSVATYKLIELYYIGIETPISYQVFAKDINFQLTWGGYATIGFLILNLVGTFILNKEGPDKRE